MDVYALFESAAIPGRNVVEFSKSGSQSLQPMGSLPVKTGIALEGPVVQQFQFANAVDGIAVASAVKTATERNCVTTICHTRRREDLGQQVEISPITQIRALTSTPYYWYVHHLPNVPRATRSASNINWNVLRYQPCTGRCSPSRPRLPDTGA